MLSSAVSQNQISLTNRPKRNTSLQCFRKILKPYLPSLPKLNTVNTADHKRKFHEHLQMSKIRTTDVLPA